MKSHLCFIFRNQNQLNCPDEDGGDGEGDGDGGCVVEGREAPQAPAAVLATACRKVTGSPQQLRPGQFWRSVQPARLSTLHHNMLHWPAGDTRTANKLLVLSSPTVQFRARLFVNSDTAAVQQRYDA